MMILKPREKFLFDYAKLEKSTLFMGIILTMIGVVLDLLAPNIISHILNVEIKMMTERFYIFVFLYFVISIGSNVLKYKSMILLEIMSNNIVKRIRDDMYTFMNNLSISFFDRYPSGKIVSKIMNDTEAVKNLYSIVVKEVITTCLYLIGIYVLLFYQSRVFGLFALAILPINIILVVVYVKYASKYNRIFRQKLSELNTFIHETILGIQVVQSFSKEKNRMEEYKLISREWSQQLKNIVVLDSLMSFNVTELLRNLSFTFVIYFFSKQAILYPDEINIGLIYVFVDYLSKIFIQIQNLMNRLNISERSLVAVESILIFFDEEKMDSQEFILEDFDTERDLTGRVEFREIYFAYKEEFVLKNISFEVKKGEKIAFVGHTGSGKSSIMNLLLQFYEPQKGKILLDEASIKDYPVDFVRKHMGIVLQEPYLFSGTIFSNIKLSNENITKEDARKMLISVGGEKFLNRLENGVDTVVSEKGMMFSLGERQMISFARALAQNPKFLILDEATSNIDTETELMIQKAIDTVSKGRTTLIIAHRLSTIYDADQIIVLDHGEIVERGTHDSLMNKKGVYCKMYETQYNQQ